MALEPLPITEFTSHEDVLDALEDVARRHGLAHRLESGRILLNAFFAGDAHAYHSPDRTKATRFDHFLAEQAKPLEVLGLGPTAARNCIRGWLVYRSLPPELQRSLFYSHLVELARVPDLALRQSIAIRAIQENSSVRDLREMVQVAVAGGDGPATGVGGGDVVPDQATPPPQQPGRIVSRMERWSRDVGAAATAWSTVDVARLAKPQRQRMDRALSELQAQVVAMRKRLGKVR